MEKSKISHKKLILINLIIFLLISTFFSTASAFSEYEKEAAVKLYQDLSQKYKITKFKEKSSEYQTLNKLENNITKNQFKNAKFELHYINDELINAFYIGDGNIMLFKGLLQKIDTESQLAGLIAHEMGHAVSEHMTETLERNTGLSILNILFNHFTDNEYQTLTNVTHNLIANGYSREQEQEADIYAAKLMMRSGYDPQGLVELMKIFKENSHSVKLLEFTQTHPIPESRIEYLEDYISKEEAKKTEKVEKFKPQSKESFKNKKIEKKKLIKKQTFNNALLSFSYPQDWEFKKIVKYEQEIKFNYKLNFKSLQGEIYLQDLTDRSFMKTARKNFEYSAIEARDNGFEINKKDLSTNRLEIYNLYLSKNDNLILKYFITKKNKNQMLRLNFEIDKKNYLQFKNQIEELVFSVKFK